MAAARAANPRRPRQRFFKRHAKVSVGIGLVLVAALVGGIHVSRERERDRERERYRGTLGAEGICREPLGSYCGVVPSTSGAGWERCSDLATTTEHLMKETASLEEVAVGTCDELKWARGSASFGGTTYYFDSRGALVAVDAWGDAWRKCAADNPGVAYRWFYGPVPSCVKETTDILKQSPSRRAPL